MQCFEYGNLAGDGAPSRSPAEEYEMKLLKTFEVSEEIFDTILKTMATRVEIVEDLSPYIYGYTNKKRLVYNIKNAEERLILQEYLFADFANIPLDKEVSSWKQIIIKKSIDKTTWQESVSGIKAYNYIIKLLSKYYSETEIFNILSSYTDVKTEENKQIHIDFSTFEDSIYEIDNCYKYDINGAHQAALIEIFPKAKSEILQLYNKRKEKPIYKSYINFFVGMLKKRGFDGAYWYIVHRTSKILKEAMEKLCPDSSLDAQIIYANTDGFIVKDPVMTLENSKELGNFKEEYHGTVYVYRNNNTDSSPYICYETNTDTAKEHKGNCRLAVRKDISLKDGIIAKYNISNKVLNDMQGKKMVVSELTNCRTETREIIKWGRK